jgi:sec-independent protein translocase protein TatA
MLLFLNDVAGSEILLILVFILIFFGSKSIPGIARTLGRTMRQIKDATQEVQNEISKSGANIRKDMNFQGLVEDTVNDIRRPLDQYADDIDEVLRPSSTPYQRNKVNISPAPTETSDLVPETESIAEPLADQVMPETKVEPNQAEKKPE